VQKIGRVIRADANTGEILVLGAGRTNDVPNGLSTTITLAGDASGSVTLTNLGSGTLTVAVSDDSHSHSTYAASSHTHSYLPLTGKAADSNLLDGLDLHTGRNNNANKVVRTDGSGYIQAGWINTTSGNHTGSIARIIASNDAYLRYVTPAHFRSQVTDGVYHAAGGSYSTDFYANKSFADNWFRSIGGTGWYAESYGGGIYMIDTTWVRTYNNKAFYSGGGVIRSDGGNAFAMPNSTGTWSFNTVRYDTNGGILRQYLSTEATKANITEMKGVLEYLNERNLIYSLRPVIFTEAEDRTDFEGNPVRTTRGEYGHGLIAEEVLEVAPELAYFGKDGELVSYGNDHLIPDIIAELQRLMPMVEELYSTANPDWVAPVPRSADSIATERAKYDEAAAAQALIGHNDISDPLNGQRHLANEE
jgi:hypothetical protein